jgi:hypothetical protein
VIAMQMSERLSVARIGFSDEGYLREDALPMFLSPYQVSVYQVLDAPWQVELGLGMTIVCALLYAAGIWTRAAGVITWLLLVS